MKPDFQTHYCEHFQYFKPSKRITLEQSPACKFCLAAKSNIWICLHKHCGAIVCGRSSYLHLNSHLQESKKNKSFHSIFMNIHTAEIRCQHCNIQIYDTEQYLHCLYNCRLPEGEYQHSLQKSESNSASRFRIAILPFLADLIKPKLQGQLQFPEGHKRINRGLVGIFGDKYNYSLVPAVQFLAHIEFFKEVILNIHLKKGQSSRHSQIIGQLQVILSKIEAADERAIRIDKLMNLVRKVKPKIDSYSRKDPFEELFDILNILHEHLCFYKFKDELGNLGRDEWDLFYRTPQQIEAHCPLYDSLVSILNLSYRCRFCQNEQNFEQSINFLKLDFPKKKRKNKVVESELNEKGYESPRKRGRSLLERLLPEQELPITIPELLIEFLKQPLHTEKYCSKCQQKKQPMNPHKMHFKKIADVLILQVNRLPKYSDDFNLTNVQFDYQDLNLSPFLQQDTKKKVGISQPNQSQVEGNQGAESSVKEIQEADTTQSYRFQTAICIENGIFPVFCQSRFNKQSYKLKHELVELTKTRGNPYVICLRKRSTLKSEELYQEILVQDDFLRKLKAESQSEKMPAEAVPLPDFYEIQLKHSIELPVYQPITCNHGLIRPQICRKVKQTRFVTEKLYQSLLESYKGTKFENEQCQECTEELKKLKVRKARERQLIKICDSSKVQAYCMVNFSWVRKWSNYLYSNEDSSFSYFHKGYPMPPPINNKILLLENKCRPNLVKNRDFKVVNVFVWKLLKDLYGGGPEIRYKWKQPQLSTLDEAKIKQIRSEAMELRSLFDPIEPSSPQKTVIMERSSSYLSSVSEIELEEELELQEPE